MSSPSRSQFGSFAGQYPPPAPVVNVHHLKPRDFDVRPMLVIWEMTQACDLSCAHCRANAQPLRNRAEFSTSESFDLIDQVAAMHVPLFVLTGEIP